MTLLLAASASAQSLVPGAAPARTPAPTPPVQVAPVPPVPPVPPKVPDKLEVGDPAPKLDVDWLAGEPVKDFAPGTTYVVEFWAPWCPWCREALPLYADLSRRFADRRVQVVGVAVWPKRSSPAMARDFVTDSDESFPYPVGEDRADKTAKAWLDAADVLIPTAFVVDGAGKIAWIGDPRQGLDKALVKQIGWAQSDDTPYAVIMRQRMAYAGEIEAAKAARLRGDWKAAAEQSKYNYEKNKLLLADEAVYYYISLVMLGEKEQARAWGERLLNVDFAARASGLNSLAWYVVDPKGAIPKEQIDLDLALRAATRADELKDHNDPYILDTLARVQFVRGELAEALRLQLRAVERASRLKGDPMADMLRKDLSDRLDQYEQAADAAADKSDTASGRP
ncbi:MAG TPA: redoxin domain-containing protein [Planctomycetota bacterium]|nr:redoxin domain-containing protein [Planctomycetota bacterium]